MKQIILIWVFISLVFLTHAQYSKHIIKLANKDGSGFTIKDPVSYLSSKALERRTRSRVVIDSTDLPVSKNYLDSIKSAGKVSILSYSKWLNQVLIHTTDAAALNKISNFSFVKKTQPIANRNSGNMEYEDKFRDFGQVSNQRSLAPKSSQSNLFNYGSSRDQIQIHHGEFLHNKGFNGKGIAIAILDGGFLNYTVLTAFDSLRIHNQILGTWDLLQMNQV